jgi:hypothetical protein
VESAPTVGGPASLKDVSVGHRQTPCRRCSRLWCWRDCPEQSHGSSCDSNPPNSCGHCATGRAEDHSNTSGIEATRRWVSRSVVDGWRRLSWWRRGVRCGTRTAGSLGGRQPPSRWAVPCVHWSVLRLHRRPWSALCRPARAGAVVRSHAFDAHRIERPGNAGGGDQSPHRAGPWPALLTWPPV